MLYFVATFFALVIASLADAQSFMGYPCTQDCSGHEAGYQWAQENEITDKKSCSTPSNSFNEGCEAAVDERDDGSDDDNESDDYEY